MVASWVEASAAAERRLRLESGSMTHTDALGNRVQSAVKGAQLSWRESASPLLEPPTREPFDAALDGELRTFDQQRDGLVCVALMHPGHGQVDEQPEARVRRGSHGECLL